MEIEQESTYSSGLSNNECWYEGAVPGKIPSPPDDQDSRTKDVFDISNDNGYFPLLRSFSLYHGHNFTGLYEWRVWCLIRNRNCVLFAKNLCSLPVFYGSVLLIFLVSVVYLCMFCLSSSCVLCFQCCRCLWVVQFSIAPSVYSDVYLTTRKTRRS